MTDNQEMEQDKKPIEGEGESAWRPTDDEGELKENKTGKAGDSPAPPNDEDAE